MSKKKMQKIPVAHADISQIQPVLEKFHTIAQELHNSTSQQEAEAALTAITSMSEANQMALLKTLSKEIDTDAADVILGINELSPIKNIRKEARRSLIRLEEARIYPQWQSPIAHIPAIAALQLLTNPPRFWKGIVTDSLDAGEAQLLLLWEQGEDYREIRVMGFLLEFWHDGIKDFFTAVESKRTIDKLIAQTMEQVKTMECTLSKGRKLIQEALEVNKKHHTQPHKDYRLHISLVNQLVLENPDIEEEEDSEDRDEISIKPDLKPTEVVVNFVEAWVDGDYDIAYNLLSEDSSLREGLTEEEWVERRDQWADEALPANLVPNFLREREAQKSGIWLPNPFSRGNALLGKEVEAGWSVELADTSDSSTPLPELPELPRSTAYYEETERHWFWTSYTLVEGPNGWRIQSMTDEGTNVQGLPSPELQKRIKENDQQIIKITEQHSPTDPDALQYFDEILWRSMQNVYYDDALIKILPLDRATYEDAAGRTMMWVELQRCLVYLERMAQQFADERGEILRRIAAVQKQISDNYYKEIDEKEIDEEEGDYEEEEERAERFLNLAEATFRESLTVEDNATAHILLADLLIEKGEDEDLDEAEDHLHQAEALTPEQIEDAIIESSLGEICILREDYDQGLSHYQRAVEIDPTLPGVWYQLGKTYRMLDNEEEAEAAFKRSIELHPDDMESYAVLVDMYMAGGRPSAARDLLEQGLKDDPNATSLIAFLASTYIESDPKRAEELLDKAEGIDPEDLTVQLFRQILETRRSEQESPQKKPRKR